MRLPFLARNICNAIDGFSELLILITVLLLALFHLRRGEVVTFA